MDSSDSSGTVSDGLPAWVNVTLIQDALRRDMDSHVSVKSVSVSPATAPGDNYCSIIYRVTATLDDGGQRTLLVKVPPKEEAMVKAIVETGLFHAESVILANYFPAMKALLDRAAPGRFPPFGARCPLHGSDPVPFLFLEDLKPHGFQIAVRHRGLGLRHSLLAIRTLARFHAASAALLQQDPNIVNRIPNPFRTCNGTWEPYVLSMFDMTIDVCSKWPGYEEYIEIMKKFQPNAMEIFTKLNDPIPGKFNVLIHGDFWTNNMMFKYDENGYVVDYRMVDLQISHVTSPAIDLLYFFNTSLSEDVSEHHQHLLLREYHNALSETLDMLGVAAPSFEQLLDDINYYGPHALYAALGAWPIQRSEIVLDIEAVIEGESNKSNFIYETQQTKKWLQRVLPEFKRRGWMEVRKIP